MRKGRIIYILIGPPAIGKSTWIQNHTDPQNTIVINRDDIVEKIANSYGWTYDDMFVYPPNEAEIGEMDEKYGKVIPAPEWMHWRKSIFSKVTEGNDKVLAIFKKSMEDAKASDKNVVVDLTNMRANDRIDGLNRISRPNDTKVAVIFNFKGKEKIIKAVAAKRAEAAERMGKSKTIPDVVIDKMISAYEPPTPKEGYDKIIYSNTIPQLKKFAGIKEVRMYIRKIINELFENKKSPQELEGIDKYPSKKQIVSILRNNLYARTDKQILGIYIIGSEAKGTAKEKSDIDVAIIIPPIRGKTSLQYTEMFHEKYPSDDVKPKWNNRPIDFQFFYPDDPELNQYEKIKIF